MLRTIHTANSDFAVNNINGMLKCFLQRPSSGQGALFSYSSAPSTAAGCQPQFMLSSIQVPGPLRKRRYGSNQHKGKYSMQLLHSGVILSGLPDYVNRLHHIKRGTAEGKLLRTGLGARARGGQRERQIPQNLQSEQTRVYSDAHGLCVKTQAVRRRYSPPAGMGGSRSGKSPVTAHLVVPKYVRNFLRPSRLVLKNTNRDIKCLTSS